MKRILPAVVAAVLGMFGPTAHGGTYSATVLYPLAVPSSLDYVPPTISDVAAGQSVGSATTAGPFGSGLSGHVHAVVWSGPSGTLTDLNPTNLAGFTGSSAAAISGAQQVGVGSLTSGGSHALLWTGSAGSAVDLNPTNLTGYGTSAAYATNGTLQVGYASGSATGNNYHAVLWSGSANSAVDLNPTLLFGIDNSFAYGTDGSQQVGIGYGYTGTLDHDHAILWSGTATSAIDLNPSALGIQDSTAEGVFGTQEVGYGDTGVSLNTSALMWNGTAASAAFLSTANLGVVYDSSAVATNGKNQVGEVEVAGATSGSFVDNAVLWSGAGTPAVNLQSLLPLSQAWISSNAESIDANGNVFGIAVASGSYTQPGGTFAIEWSPVPEPVPTTILTVCSVALLGDRRRGRSVGR